MKIIFWLFKQIVVKLTFFLVGWWLSYSIVGLFV